MRRSILNFLLPRVFVCCLATGACAVAAQADDGFRQFLEGVWPEAKTQGVSRATFDRAVSGLQPDYAIPDLAIAGRAKVENGGQAEFTKTAADYMPKSYMEKLAAQGQVFFKRHRAVLLLCH